MPPVRDDVENIGLIMAAATETPSVEPQSESPTRKIWFNDLEINAAHSEILTFPAARKPQSTMSHNAHFTKNPNTGDKKSRKHSEDSDSDNFKTADDDDDENEASSSSSTTTVGITRSTSTQESARWNNEPDPLARLQKTRKHCKHLKQQLQAAQAELATVRDEQGWANDLETELQGLEWKLKLMEKMNSNVSAENKLLKLKVHQDSNNKASETHIIGSDIRAIQEQLKLKFKLMGKLETLSKMKDVHKRMHQENVEIRQRFQALTQKANELAKLYKQQKQKVANLENLVKQDPGTQTQLEEQVSNLHLKLAHVEQEMGKLKEMEMQDSPQESEHHRGKREDLAEMKAMLTDQLEKLSEAKTQALELELLKARQRISREKEHRASLIDKLQHFREKMQTLNQAEAKIDQQRHEIHRLSKKLQEYQHENRHLGQSLKEADELISSLKETNCRQADEIQELKRSRLMKETVISTKDSTTETFHTAESQSDQKDQIESLISTVKQEISSLKAQEPKNTSFSEFTQLSEFVKIWKSLKDLVISDSGSDSLKKEAVAKLFAENLKLKNALISHQREKASDTLDKEKAWFKQQMDELAAKVQLVANLPDITRRVLIHEFSKAKARSYFYHEMRRVTPDAEILQALGKAGFGLEPLPNQVSHLEPTSVA
ncbi:unnamed protein product [Notodromas monacha]|uniref:Uncharacterized protein n=1 Tax=Notodromas monacha TaxID=399045 RepID=A0A7R9BRM2_9CRUS|nr:unnamed protein product [Notodromas monacha]CAG0919055.1 unnamed protein product [Notodromas monacha]